MIEARQVFLLEKTSVGRRRQEEV